MKYQFALRISRPLIVMLLLCLFVSWTFIFPCFSSETLQESSAKRYTLPQAKPEEVGLSSERLQELTTFIEKSVEEKKIPGAVVLVARN